MKQFDKEFYELMSAFERDIKKMPRIYLNRLDRTDKNSFCNSDFYQHGEINGLFISYMTGYQNAKSLVKQDDTILDE
jgi:hypothetical protein